MISFNLPSIAQQTIADNLKEHRLKLNLTQEGLSKRSGVPLATLRKFEQQAQISFESFVKLLSALQLVEDVVAATKVQLPTYTTIDEVIARATTPKRKRGAKT